MFQLVCPIKSINYFGKDFVIHSFSSVVNTPSMTPEYGVPLRSKYPDSEMLFQKQNNSRDLQNMMRKL